MMARQPPLEIEAKLLVERESALRTIAWLQQIDRFRLRARDVARLYSIYIDTEDLDLAHRGIALRLRRHARRWELTAKWPGRISGVMHERPEVTIALSARPRFPFHLERGLYPKVDSLIAHRALRPILITDIRRRRIDVLPVASKNTRRPLAELALDRVRLRAPERDEAAATYCEIEIERVAGTRRDVARLAQALQERFGLTPSKDSKFSRGLSLLYGAARLPRRATARRVRRP